MKKFICDLLYVIKYLLIYFLVLITGVFIFNALNAGLGISKDMASEYLYVELSLFFLIIICTFYKIKKKNILEYCNVEIFKFSFLIHIFFCMISLNFICLILAAYTTKFFPSYNQVSQSISNSLGSPIGLITVIFIAPVFEETLCRGLIFNKLKERFSLIFSTIVQGLIFGAIHGNMVQFIYATIMGIVLGVILNKTGSILACIFGHIVFNIFGGIIFPMLVNRLDNVLMLSIMLVLCTIIFILSIITLKKKGKREYYLVDNINFFDM